MRRLFLMLGLTACAIALAAVCGGSGARVIAATPPPSPPPLTIAPTPGSGQPIPQATSHGIAIPLPTPKAGATPSPSPDDRKGLDGVWEVQIQTADEVIYDHFKLTQKANVLTGFFLDNQHNNKKYPVAGSVDGKTIRLVVTKDDGSTMTFTGTVDGTTDMVGLMQSGSQQIAFTAAYRPKYKWIDTINASPGGMIGTGSGSPP